VQAIRAQDADKYGAHSSDEQSGVEEGIGHSQNPGSQTAFEQVDERLGISVSNAKDKYGISYISCIIMQCFFNFFLMGPPKFNENCQAPSSPKLQAFF